MGMDLRLGRYAPLVDARLQEWSRDGFARRLWQKDPAIWGQASDKEITDRLGWLELPRLSGLRSEAWKNLRDQVRDEGMSTVVLLGMGGSSLAPEVLSAVTRPAPGWPLLRLLDSTHPDAIAALEAELDLASTLFIVASKSGTTLETVSLFRYFFQRVAALGGAPGRHFIAITDAGTALEEAARKRDFRHTATAPSDVGGRFSALSAFGLLPAWLVGIDVPRLLQRSLVMADSCGPDIPPAANPGLVLGAALGALALGGRDKVAFLTSPSLRAFPDWIEQLLAESTGKDGKGILPVVGEDIPGWMAADRAGADASGQGAPSYGGNRVLVYLKLASEPSPEADALLRAAEAQGTPAIAITLESEYDLGAEMYRWEVATAGACAVLGVHPFNQPDVELSKELARRAMAQPAAQPGPASPTAGGGGEAEADARAAASRALQAIRALVARPAEGAYTGVQAYLAPSSATSHLLGELGRRLGLLTRLPTTVGYGPRFLHSTGQLHKGGPRRGIFIQIVDRPAARIRVPDTEYTFADLIRAQAQGDFEALRERGQRVTRIVLAGNAQSDLAALVAELEGKTQA
jgi:transaldolase/glucose-6-phosphate isomerase